ncbi:MAG: Abortive infection protein AbiEi [Candidatus Delongbacteria bacterium]|nr:Abortive infection protein AbiEi [Candidatus Delongbacteria bacterium]
MCDLIKYLEEKKVYVTLKELKLNKIHTSAVKKQLDNGMIEKIKHGLYRLSNITEPKNISLPFVDVSKAVPDSVICLLSALSHYDLTTFNNPEVNIAILRNCKVPKEINQPVKVYYFSEKTFNLGIASISTKYGKVRIYDREKTICDIFRYRDKIGEDIAYEALKNYANSKNTDYFKLMQYAKVCRIYPVINQSLKAITG